MNYIELIVCTVILAFCAFLGVEAFTSVFDALSSASSDMFSDVSSLLTDVDLSSFVTLPSSFVLPAPLG